MTCDEIREVMNELVDGEIPEDRRAGIDAHLAACEDCLALVTTLRLTCQIYREEGLAEVPPGVHRRLSEAMASETEGARRRRPEA